MSPSLPGRAEVGLQRRADITRAGRIVQLRGTTYDLTLRDRIIIFEDSKGTGHFDKRTVFWDQGKRLTSIAVGFGGVFATCAPNLIFIPDRNGDDVPDGPPEILLAGWNGDVVRHNVVNGLKWGPDSGSPFDLLWIKCDLAPRH